MMLRVMGEVVKLGKVIEGSRRARGAEGKIVAEGGELSGGYGVQEADAPAMKESDMGKAQGMPTSSAGAPCVQLGGSLRRWLWQCCWCGRWNTRPAPAAYSP